MTLNTPCIAEKEQRAAHLRTVHRGLVAARKHIDRVVGKRQTELERVLSVTSLGLSHELPSELFRHPARSPKGYDCNGLGHIVLTSSVRASLMKTLLKQWPKMLTSLSTFQQNRQGNLTKIALPSVIVCGCYSLLQKGCGGAMRPTPEDVVIRIIGLPEIQMSIPGGRLALCSAPGSAIVVG